MIFDAIVVNFACKSIWFTPLALACLIFKYSFDSAKGAVEILKPQNSGILIQNRSKQDMVKAVCSLIDDYEYRRKLGQTSRENAERYSLPAIKQQWMDLIEIL